MKIISIILILALSFQSCTSWRVSTSSSYPSQNFPQIGQRVQVSWKNSWYDATIIDARNNQYYIHYEGYGNSFDEWVTPDRIRFNRGYQNNGNNMGTVGQAVRVLQRGTWYDATIVQIANNQYYVKYNNYNEYEWVTPDRVQFSNYGPNTGYYVGQSVKIEQRNIWYDAKIIQIANNQYYIKYNNYNEYEWVTIDRIRMY